jgi:tetratricopeptide (TPR) repeat protein
MSLNGVAPRLICLILIQAFACASCLWAGQENGAGQELPRLVLDNFSSSVRGQIEEAYSSARNHPENPVANGRLGMILQTYGLLQEAAVCYRHAAELAPSDFRWVYYLALVEADRGDCEQAGSSFRQALRINSDYVPAKLRLADCLLASADWDASSKLYSEVLEQDSVNSGAYYGLGKIRAHLGDYVRAVDDFQKAIASFPDFGAAHYGLALAYRALGHAAEAEEQLQLYERDKVDAPPIGDQLLAEVHALNRSATYQVQLGAELERRGKLEESAAAHEEALKLDPQLVQAHINLIRLYGQLGQFQKAEEHYRAAVRIDPASVEASYNHGVLLLGAENYQAAEDAFRKAIETNPYYADAHNNLGYVLERRGNLAEAAAEYRKAIESKPGDRQAHFNLGRILVNQQDYKEGIQELEKTIQPEDENTPRYLYALGAAFARSGDRQTALRYIRQAREKAAARGQTGLLASIDRDLRALQTRATPK